MVKRRSYGKTSGIENVSVKEQFNPHEQNWMNEWMNEWGHEVEVNDTSAMTVVLDLNKNLWTQLWCGKYWALLWF